MREERAAMQPELVTCPRDVARSEPIAVELVGEVDAPPAERCR
jgi:hypothetical protein